MQRALRSYLQTGQTSRIMVARATTLGNRNIQRMKLPAFVVLATHRLKPGRRAEWLELATVNAQSARCEPGCLQFDVVVSREDLDTGFLIEMYVDEAAWKEHFRQPYCKAFMTAIEDMLHERVRILGDRFGP